MLNISCRGEGEMTHYIGIMAKTTKPIRLGQLVVGTTIHTNNEANEGCTYTCTFFTSQFCEMFKFLKEGLFLGHMKMYKKVSMESHLLNHFIKFFSPLKGNLTLVHHVGSWPIQSTSIVSHV